MSLAFGSNYPVVVVEERYRRILNANIMDLRTSRAAITSPIYAR